jgi:tetratricopeptide (TPR) repeat protein
LAGLGQFEGSIRRQEGIVAADSKAKLLQDAERFVLHGKIQQAIGEYLKVIKLDPDDVLILNTIGDLYLRQNNGPEANKYFSRVAESYVQNNFFLKAIAVYKKILSADSNNLDINLTMASLFAKQGLSLDARNQYLRVASLLEKDGKTKECVDVYEKIAELDPSNSAIQKKLAELHLANGAKERAHTYWAGAARAQVKGGDLEGAMDSYKRAMDLDPLDAGAMRGFLECCRQMGNLEAALEQLKKSVDLAPQNLDMREMLGQAHLAIGDPSSAAKALQVLISMDESRYESFFPVAEELIDEEAYDQALSFMDHIIPILITRRETERAMKLYELILQRSPKHVPALAKLASLCNAAGDQMRYLTLLDEIAEHYLSIQSPVEAIEYLEKILQVEPGSDKHRKLHQQAFTEAYPDTPYKPPAAPQESPAETGSAAVQIDSTPSADGGQSAVVEVDLLLNYGLRDKAMSLLLNLESRDPYDREVRARLLSIYKIQKKNAEAAKQCLLLAVLHRRAKNEESARNYLAEAKQLDPDTVDSEPDLDEFARRNGIAAKPAESAASSTDAMDPNAEVDLSGDLLDIFFADGQEAVAGEESEPQSMPAEIAEGFSEGKFAADNISGEEYSQDIASQASPKSVEELLQEADFYIRLGFNDEALTKLNEIAKISPDNAELAARYEKLGAAVETSVPAPELSGNELPSGFQFEKAASTDEEGGLGRPDIGSVADHFMESGAAIEDKGEESPLQDSMAAGKKPAEKSTGPSRSQSAAAPSESAGSDFQMNEMFADLMEEVDGPEDQAAARDFFEEHFSLGTAYREMDLIEEAIKEFESALKNIDIKSGDQKVIQCCGMLSTCFLEKKMPRSALRWCQTGLSVAKISSHEAMALRYDMGIAHSMAGSNKQALECFDQIFNTDPSYRDVAQRIDELKGGFEQHAPSP